MVALKSVHMGPGLMKSTVNVYVKSNALQDSGLTRRIVNVYAIRNALQDSGLTRRNAIVYVIRSAHMGSGLMKSTVNVYAIRFVHLDHGLSQANANANQLSAYQHIAHTQKFGLKDHAVVSVRQRNAYMVKLGTQISVHAFDQKEKSILLLLTFYK